MKQFQHSMVSESSVADSGERYAIPTTSATFWWCFLWRHHVGLLIGCRMSSQPSICLSCYTGHSEWVIGANPSTELRGIATIKLSSIAWFPGCFEQFLCKYHLHLNIFLYFVDIYFIYTYIHMFVLFLNGLWNKHDKI